MPLPQADGENAVDYSFHCNCEPLPLRSVAPDA